MGKFIRGVDLLALGFLMYLFLLLMPLKWFWYDVEYVTVFDAKIGSPSRIEVGRTILRDTQIAYQVTVRNGEGIVMCDASSKPFTYRTTSKIPDDADLAWWAPSDQRCANLPIGSYIMETCWTAYGRFWVLPAKTVCKNSNVFQVWAES